MAEDDEIDVLGDFTVDCLDMLPKNETNMYDNSSLMSGSEILNLNDYTIHPQWLLDKPSTNPACWYNTGSEFGLNYEQSSTGTAEVTTESITDESGWTEKEKDLIKRGIEIFGKSHVRLSQFVGSRTPAEVRYFLKNFSAYLEKPSMEGEIVFENCLEETIITHENTQSIDYTEILDSNEIPASIEEVIAAVSTAKPTVPVNKGARAKKKSTSCDEYDIKYENIPSGQSLLKSNYSQFSNQEKSEKAKVGKGKKLSSLKTSSKVPEKRSKVKFKANVVIPKSIQKPKILNKRRKSSKSTSESSDSHVVTNEHEIVTGSGSVRVCDGEEVVKILKEECSEESDVDIEDFEEESTSYSKNTAPITKIDHPPISTAQDIKPKSEPVNTKPKIEETPSLEASTKNLPVKKRPDLSNLDKVLVDQLMDLNNPSCEVKLSNEITDLEKFIHFEFFEGRPTKTPERYLKIRNHIINNWTSNKPSYVTKTSVRNGLKQCGDVNCIGRVHTYLEQIGAINFGCSQTSYIRPLYEIVSSFNVCKEKNGKEPDNDVVKQKLDVLNARPRFKKKYVKDGEGGCTFLHDERGDVIDTTVVNEEPTIKKSYVKKAAIRLIYCRPFSEDNKPKFSVNMDLSVVLLMDLHAHSSLSEVMGLVGGIWDTHSNKLHITRFEPCKNIAPSSTHCDMCPISQAKATDRIHNSGLDVLGWFHSHPTFAPEPSQQDIETQLSVQQWIGAKTPCVGIILSPFSGHGALISSPFRCLIVDKKENFEDQLVPYKFKVNLISENMNVKHFLSLFEELINCEYIPNENRVNFNKNYFQDVSITFLEKFLTSLKMHLAKCSTLNKMTCDAIIQGVIGICKSK